MKRLVSKLPWWVKKPARWAINTVNILLYYGSDRTCPVCGKSSKKFRQFGNPPRKDAQCPRCGALERHRMAWLFLQKKTNFFDNRQKKMLHLAPEFCFEPRFKKQLGTGYLTADLTNSRAMVNMDITDIQYPDKSFDIIYCSHVLEHVDDDHRAMREFFRILKNDGWAILLVPIKRKETFEDPSIVAPKARLQAFGQEDHVRLYGLDFVDRLRNAGFNVEIIQKNHLIDKKNAELMGLKSSRNYIFYCTK